MQWTLLCIGIMLGCAPLCWSAEPSTPYAGQEQREIKALSAEEIQSYLSGSGMGLSKAAAGRLVSAIPSHTLEELSCSTVTWSKN
jgi:hypothetical protein